MKKLGLVFIPSPGIGHLIPTIKLAKLLLQRDGRFSISILVIKQALGPSIDSQSYTDSYPEIQFIHLPQMQPPPIDLFFKSVEIFVSVYMESYKDLAKETIVSHVLPNCERLVGLVVDMFCTSMIDLGNELGFPSYLFFASGAAVLGFVLQLPTREEQGNSEFEISETESVDIPTYINPVPTTALPSFASNKEGGYACFVNHARRFKETKGILVNTFNELESHAVSSLSVYGDDLPPVYTVGPLITHKSQYEKGNIMAWLDEQPPSSVVFLCFGSSGSFNESQIRETAIALEESGHRFLWSIKVTGKDKFGTPDEGVNYGDEIFPEGFLERTKKRGFLCRWTPQVEVLAHKAVGCFVSHCGWNSVLESVWYGVPIVTWPIYAEQQINAFELVKDLGLAVELKIDYKSGSDVIVKSDEIGKAVKCAMEDGEVRKKFKEISEKSRQAVNNGGGSSFVSIGKLIEAMMEES